MCLLTWFSFALYEMTRFTSFVLAMLALWHLVWVSLLLFASFHLCFHLYACVLVCVIKHNPYLLFCASSHPSLYTKSQVPFRNFFWWYMSHLYSNKMEPQTRNPNSHMSFQNTLFCLLVCSLACFLYLFANILVFCQYMNLWSSLC